MATILLALFGAMVVGETVRPAVNRLGARMGVAAATALVFGGLFAVLAALALLPLQWLFRQAIALASHLPWYAAYAADVFGHLRLSREEIGSLAAGIARDPLGLGPVFSTLGLTLVMALFWLGASTQLTAFTLSLLPPNRRDAAASVLTEIGAKLGAYVGGTLVNVAIVTAVGTLGLVMLHVRFALALGLFQGVLHGIPYLGTFIAVMTALLVVGSTQDWLKGAEAATLLAVVHTLEGSVISPLIFKKHVDIDPLGCVVATAVGGVLFGIPGVVLAVPAASVVQTLVVRVVAPLIRRRSIAVVLIVLLAVAGAVVPVRAQDTPLTGDQILARAAHADGVSGYSVPIHFQVHLRRPIGARSGVDGVATYTAPAQAALTITQVPGPIGTFFRGTYQIDLVPQTWSSKYRATAVSEGMVAGAKVYVVQAQPVPASPDIDGVTFQVAQADFAPLSAIWHYHNGSSIQLALVDQPLNSMLVPKTATISVAMPGYALDASATYGAYAVR